MVELEIKNNSKSLSQNTEADGIQTSVPQVVIQIMVFKRAWVGQPPETTIHSDVALQRDTVKKGLQCCPFKKKQE